MNHNKKAAIILAAGMGTRMKSTIPKVMHNIAGMPMISHVVQTCENAGIDNLKIIIGPDMDDLKTIVSPHSTLIQHDRNGTGGAAKQAQHAFDDIDGYIFILNGDNPLIKAETLNCLYDQAQETGLSVLGFEAENPHGYGRFIIEGNHVSAIIEEKDCTDNQRAITACNAGAYCVSADKLFGWLDQVTNDNAQSEYYLTDIIAIAAKENTRASYVLADEAETLGINSRTQLAIAESVVQKTLRQRAMDNGVTMIAPETVTLSMDTDIATDVIIEPNVVFGRGVRVGSHARIHAFSHIEGADIGEHSAIGPFARIRPKSKIGDHVTVGNFIEVNRSEFKDGAKSKHVSYIGDAIIGEKTNIGAGTVFANYDGFQKHISTTGKGSFVGSNSTIISPVHIGDGAIVAAGSTISADVNNDALAMSRAKQLMRDGWAKSFREKHKK